MSKTKASNTPLSQLLSTEQILCVGNNLMVIISMFPQYQMGYHLCKSKCVITSQRAIVSSFLGDVKPAILYGKLQAAQVQCLLHLHQFDAYNA